MCVFVCILRRLCRRFFVCSALRNAMVVSGILSERPFVYYLCVLLNIYFFCCYFVFVGFALNVLIMFIIIIII